MKSFDIQRTTMALALGTVFALGAGTPAFAKTHPGQAPDQKAHQADPHTNAAEKARLEQATKAAAQREAAGQAQQQRTRQAAQERSRQQEQQELAARRAAAVREHNDREARERVQREQAARNAALTHRTDDARKAREQAADRERAADQARQSRERLAHQKDQARQEQARLAEQRAREQRLHQDQARDRRLQQKRLSQLEQQRLINVHRQRELQYQHYLVERQSLALRRAQLLQQQHRMAQYRYQQQYYDRLRLQRQRLAASRYNYYNDPYFYTPASYRYSWGGASYQTNQYGADMLRQAVNYGYSEGVRAGRADRQDRWRANYRDSWAYQDANYGYNGYYLSQADYNNYFRQGFQRGYDDGYYGRDQYGRYDDNGNGSILESLLSVILNLQPLG
ncbi:MAG: hypothetical protein ACJ8GK_00120 [Luteimonas sp.]